MKTKYSIGDEVIVTGSNAIIVGIYFDNEGTTTYTVRYKSDGRERKCYENQIVLCQPTWRTTACGRYKIGPDLK